MYTPDHIQFELYKDKHYVLQKDLTCRAIFNNPKGWVGGHY